MPPKGSKRVLSEQAVDRKRCKVVADALVDHPIFAEVVPTTLGVYADVRHAYQTRFVNMMGETIANIGSELAAAEAAAKATVDGAAQEQEARDSAVTTAKEAESAKKEILNEKEAAAKAAAEEAKSAAQVLKEAEAAAKAGDLAFLDAEKTKGMLEVAVAKFAQIKETVLAPPEIKEVVAACKKLEIDEEVLNYLPESSKKEPGSRSQFDEIVIKSADDLLAKSLSELTKTVADGESAKVARAAAVESAKAAEAAASEKQSASQDACHTASNDLKEATKALKEAQLAVSSYASDMKKASKELAAATKAMASFNDGALVAFNALKDKTTPPPPEEPKVVEAAVETAPEVAKDA